MHCKHSNRTYTILDVFTGLHIFIVGSHTVIHPCAKILAETGPIVIGENNLIEENVTIINK